MPKVPRKFDEVILENLSVSSSKTENSRKLRGFTDEIKNLLSNGIQRGRKIVTLNYSVSRLN